MLLQERDGSILTITLNMPEKRNPISDVAVVDAICNAFEEADRDISVRCVILTGAGTAFSAGGDLKQMRPDSGGQWSGKHSHIATASDMPTGTARTGGATRRRGSSGN